MSFIVLPYVVTGLVWCITCVILYAGADLSSSDEEHAARMFFMTPIWPLMVLLGLSLYLYEMWKTANFSKLLGKKKK